MSPKRRTFLSLVFACICLSKSLLILMIILIMMILITLFKCQSIYHCCAKIIGETIHEPNMFSEHNFVKNPNWLEADQLAIYRAWPWFCKQDYCETNPSGRSGT